MEQFAAGVGITEYRPSWTDTKGATLNLVRRQQGIDEPIELLKRADRVNLPIMEQQLFAHHTDADTTPNIIDMRKGGLDLVADTTGMRWVDYESHNDPAFVKKYTKIHTPISDTGDLVHMAEYPYSQIGIGSAEQGFVWRDGRMEAHSDGIVAGVTPPVKVAFTSPAKSRVSKLESQLESKFVNPIKGLFKREGMDSATGEKDGSGTWVIILIVVVFFIIIILMAMSAIRDMGRAAQLLSNPFKRV
jgi:hypothetical protein